MIFQEAITQERVSVRTYIAERVQFAFDFGDSNFLIANPYSQRLIRH